MDNNKLVFERVSQTNIFIGSDLFSALAHKIRTLNSKQCVVVTNETISSLYSDALKQQLQENGIAPTFVIIKDGESYKSIDTAYEIINQLSRNEIDRACPIIGFGGGVVCDITGFVASIYKRGLPLILFPTSLLAMVDASFGGKNAVNTPTAKNLAGTFYQPIMTFMDVSILKSLPLSQLYYGLVEALKHGLISDMAYFNYIINNLDEIKQKQESVLERLIRRSVHIKSDFILTDELDLGKRAHLNFGHTFGHAIETIGNYLRFNHAEAVGLGMLMAIKASNNVGIAKDDFSSLLSEILKKIELPITLPIDFTADKIIEAIKSDKKRNSEGIKFILTEEPGKTMPYIVKIEDLENFVKNSMI